MTTTAELKALREALGRLGEALGREDRDEAYEWAHTLHVQSERIRGRLAREIKEARRESVT